MTIAFFLINFEIWKQKSNGEYGSGLFWTHPYFGEQDDRGRLALRDG